jgi:peptide/nickel transport system substrate-binding protein
MHKADDFQQPLTSRESSMRTRSIVFQLSLATLLSCSVAGSIAADLKIVMSSPPTALDPHFYYATANVGISEHMFESLTKLDADSRIVPGLAKSWRLLDERTWEF